MLKNLPANAGNIRCMGLIPGLGRSPEEGTAATPVFLLGEFHDRIAWWATAHGVAKNWT